MSRCVVVAMSGGVDSSVSAAILRDRGDEVIGVGLRFPDAADDGDARTCCGMAGMEDARRVAALLDIPFYVLDHRELFDREVIAPFCRAYVQGETPNPCILCNIRLKFGRLLDAALAMGADYVATGHYARLEPAPDGGSPRLLKGRDQAHDQSYFLYALTAYQREHALFPVGELTKPQVRAIAARLGLPVADKPGSQDICFVGQEGYRALVAAREPGAEQPGPILDDTGRVLGYHRGLAGFTLGQRRGLGIAAKERLYVIALDPARNVVIVGPQAETLTSSVRVDHVNWLIEDVSREPQYMAVRARYRGLTVAAEVRLQGEHARVTWATPQPRVAAGQAVVFYHGDRVLGGGIARAASATESHLTEMRESAYV